MTQTSLVLCKASAGSGKTFMLAKTYLQIVLDFEHEQYCNYDRILAVTFTNKATEEMKSRILKFLTEISQITSEDDVKNCDIAKVLLAENPHWDYLSIAWKAKIALSKILHDYSQFSIMTIDKFFNRIVKSFLFELKLQNSANVSMDTKQALDDSVAQMLSEYSHQDGHILSKWLKEISFDKINDGKDWKPDNIISRLSGEIFKEHVAKLDIHYEVDQLQALLDKIRDVENDYIQTMKDHARHILDKLGEENMMTDCFSSNYIPKKLTAIADDPIKNVFTDNVLASIYKDEPPFPKKLQKSPLYSHYSEIWFSTIQPMLHEMLDYKDENLIIYNTFSSFKKYLKALALLSDVLQKMKEYRERNGIMLISDNNQLIQRVVGNTDAPFLYEKLGNKYRYILLDEFQDTSTLQWKNFLPLVREILSHRESCKVLIVGDAKQAIYRFRGGNFQLIQKEVQSDLRTFWNEPYSLKILDKNFRSYKEIVEFNNHFFEHLSQNVQSYLTNNLDVSSVVTPLHSTITDLYDTSSQQEPVNPNVGYVEVKFADPQLMGVNEEEFDVEVWTNEYILSTISHLIQNKNYKQNDIAILVRTNKEAVHVSNVLKQEGYQVMTSEALLFNANKVIQLLIASLELLLNPTLDLHRAAVLYKYAHVHHLMEDHPDLLDKDKRDLLFEKWLPEFSADNILNLLGTLSIFEIIRNLMDILKLHPCRDAYTEQFLDMVMQYQVGAKQSSIIDFLDWWKLKERSISVSDENEAIQVLTIHKSKGLEYKVVIIPYFKWELVKGNRDDQPILWPSMHDPQEMFGFENLPIDHWAAKETLYVRDFQEETILQASENLNIAYVALTRAAEKLYIVAPLRRSKDGLKFERIGELTYLTLNNTLPKNFVDESTFKLGEENSKIIKIPKKGEVNRLLEVEERRSNSTYQLAELSFQSEEAIIGDLIHDIISAYKPTLSLEEELKKFAHAYHLEEDQRSLVLQRVKNFFLHPEIKKLYELPGKIYTERTFVYQGDSFRFDWLILNGKEGQLYDFKTGDEKINASRNKKAILLYKEALEQMGYHISKVAFIYIDVEGLPKFEYIE